MDSSFAVVEYRKVWEFTVNGGTMTGKVTDPDDYAYLGLDSNSGGFVLTKT